MAKTREITPTKKLAKPDQAETKKTLYDEKPHKCIIDDTKLLVVTGSTAFYN